MITGSFLTEKFNETSDVDIIILSNIFRSVCVLIPMIMME